MSFHFLYSTTLNKSDFFLSVSLKRPIPENWSPRSNYLTSWYRSSTRNGGPMIVMAMITNQSVNNALRVDSPYISAVGDVHSSIHCYRDALGMCQPGIFSGTLIPACTIIARDAALSVADDLENEYGNTRRARPGYVFVFYRGARLLPSIWST